MLILSPNCVSSNGSINLNVNGGVGPYSFDWSDGSSFQDLTNASGRNLFCNSNGF